MRELIINRLSTTRQFGISLALVVAMAALCYGLSGYLGYRVVAFILLLTVSLIAISFDILPVMFAAMLSAGIWDFFFIPPRFNFHVDTAEDSFLLLMYFVIAMINAVLTYKIRQVEKASRKKEEKANAIKLYNTFFNSLSHELRTPIAAIVAATDNLMLHNGNLSASNKEQLLGEISKASMRLNREVENLLNLSRLESGFLKPKKDWCDITEVIYDAVQKLEEDKVKQSITISVKPNIPLFRLDKVMLEQVIYNLVSNACLYNEPDALITVAARNYADILQLVIEDNGHGFPEAEIQQVFEKFYRLKNSRTSGTGLGLSIVKGFTDALGGNIQLQNIPTGGARFIIDIPGETSYLKA